MAEVPKDTMAACPRSCLLCERFLPAASYKGNSGNCKLCGRTRGRLYWALRGKPAVRDWVRTLSLNHRRLVFRCYASWVQSVDGIPRKLRAPFDFHALAADMGDIIEEVMEIEEP